MMRSIFFNYYGFGVEVKSFNESLIEKLKRDFSFFLSRKKSKNFSVYITKEPAFLKIPKTIKKIKYKDTVCYFYGKRKIIVYRAGIKILSNYGKHKAVVFYKKDRFLHEIVYLLILSRVGEYLDRIGLHRVHSLGFEYKQSGYLLLLPEKGGKTTMALKILEEDNVKLFSDDIPLIDKNLKIYPFPLRLGVLNIDNITDFLWDDFYVMNRRKYGKKYLFDIKYFKNKIAKKESFLKVIFIGKRINGIFSEISYVSKLTGFYYLFKSLVLGIGTPQVVEIFFEFNLNDLYKKIGIFLNRLHVTILIVLKTKFLKITLGKNFEKNKNKLLEAID